MKLKDLSEQATPLPLFVTKQSDEDMKINGTEAWSEVYEIKNADHFVAFAINKNDAALLAHSANSLPKVIAALEAVLDEADDLRGLPACEAACTLLREIKEVKLTV